MTEALANRLEYEGMDRGGERGGGSGGMPVPLLADTPIAIDFNSLQDLYMRERLAGYDSQPQDSRLALSIGVKLCTHHRSFGAPRTQLAHFIESHQRAMPDCTGLPGFVGLIASQLRRAATYGSPGRVCNLCISGALGDERHILLVCPALAGLSLQLSLLLLSLSSVMRRLRWAKNQNAVDTSKLALTRCHRTGLHCPIQMLFHPISLAGCQG